MAEATILDSIRVIDTDTHVSEPADLWTSRVPAKYLDKVPTVGVHPHSGIKHWKIGDMWLASTGYFAAAGTPDYPPASYYRELEDADPGSWEPHERLKRMDEYGIFAQVLYPNLIGFEAPLFMDLGSEESLVCTRAYNDFLVDFASADPDRLLPIAMVPFWNVEASVAEIRRSRDLGHKGVLFANKMEKVGMPSFTDPHWDPIYAVCQELEMSINFHIGFSNSRDGWVTADSQRLLEENFDGRQMAWTTPISMMSNAESIAKLIASGVCDRFPRLNFVSVESGMGYVPYLLESMDWHWNAYAAHLKHPMYPSEYFRRQFYGTFWFERQALSLLELYPDNFMFETDYPHPTSLSPGPASLAERPGDHIAGAFANVPDDVARKALHDNAARVYNLS
jgi:uncharacterized protein